MPKKSKQKRSRFASYSVSLQMYLLFTFAIFMAIAIAVTWIFQIFLLNFFHESGQKRELHTIADKMSIAIVSGEAQKTAEALSESTSAGIVVIHINGSEITKTLAVPGFRNIHLKMFPPETLNHLYQKAVEVGGSYMTKITAEGQEIHTDFWDGLFPNRFENEPPTELTSLLYTRVLRNNDGTEDVLFLNISLVPLDSTVSTLKLQFLWIAGILLTVSILISIPVSKRLLRPIRNMNVSAQKLAKGDYNVDFFSGSGYRETKELAETLNYASQELSRTDQLQKELIANISHDLRTPLTMIRAYSEVMRDIPGENSPENIQVVIDETARLSELVTDLLDLSRIQSGTTHPVMEFFDLSFAVREVLGRYETLTRMQGYTIQLDFREDHASVFADRGMILQVIYNLINNAINYTGEDKKVFVRQTVEDGSVRIDVIDTGAGIEPEQLPLIWDRYYKIDRVHRMACIGTGLGLSIVKGILELHNARYGVESTVGKGSCFWFALPVSEPPTGAVLDAPEPPVSNGKEPET